jgi:peptidoglycan/xylan/chitin deacetylase (PgdA/CDA1 family)/glycosyltransferase involved in cell wall biosynthesis
MKFSIVVPAYNEETLLPACLDSLLAQDFDGDLEIVVVDNASTDRTAEVARARGVEVVEEPRRGYSLALARGYTSVTGEIVASTDADSVVPPDWVSRLARTYEENPDVVAIGGEIVFRDPTPWARLFTHGLLPALNRVDRRNPKGPHLWGANFSVRRAVLEAAGGWNVDMNLQTDTELSERLRPYGRVILLEDLYVHTSCRRWNRSLLWNLFLYASNFAALEIWRKPLWRGFPDIRESLGEQLAHRARLRAMARPQVWRPVRVWSLAAALSAVLAVGLYDMASPWSAAFGKTRWNGPSDDRVVALTFDDGPEEPYTSEVLDILHREHATATFFLIGDRVARDPATAARIVRDGNAVGNHSESHPFALAMEPAADQRREIDRAERTIHAATGVYPRIFRPPQGLRSPWLMQVTERDSLETVTWDDAAGDWNRLTPAEVEGRIVAQAHPGAIILLHDGLNLDWHADRSVVVKALPSIIERLRREGYRFVTVPELLHTPAGLPRWAHVASPG